MKNLDAPARALSSPLKNIVMMNDGGDGDGDVNKSVTKMNSIHTF